MTPPPEVPRVSTTLTFADRLGSAKARWGIGRMHYVVTPGLYQVGRPGPDSPVLVTANYKMSFDRLRCAMAGIAAWIVVLDTKGINVWCAAGKGTFGTDEIVARVTALGLGDLVSHRTLILPQLSAPGVAAHEVKADCGFRVVYGPVRAEDLPAFLAAGMKATPEMRRVRFSFRDRVVLMPLELVMSLKYLLPIAAVLLVLAGLGADGYSLHRAVGLGVQSVVLLLAGVLGGTVLAPALLPWLPGRAFSVKGTAVGLILAAGAAVWIFGSGNVLHGIAWVLLLPAVASFLAMNFTGASTYTSLSGVRREMRIAVPLQIVGAAAGVGLWVTGLFV